MMVLRIIRSFYEKELKRVDNFDLPWTATLREGCLLVFYLSVGLFFLIKPYLSGYEFLFFIVIANIVMILYVAKKGEQILLGVKSKMMKKKPVSPALVVGIKAFFFVTMFACLLYNAQKTTSHNIFEF